MANDYKDKEIECMQCGETFVWTAGEQKFYDEKGLENEPKTCPTCRDKRKEDKAIEIECEICGTKGHIKSIDKKRADNSSIICRDCMEEKTS